MNTTNQYETTNIEAEQGLLGSLFLNPTLVNECYIQPSEMYFKKHQLILKAMYDVFSEHNHVDLAALFAKFDDSERETIGGYSYVSDLMNSQFHDRNFKTYQKLIRDTFKVRKAVEFSINFSNYPSIDSLHKMSQKISELIEDEIVEETSNFEVLQEIYEEIFQPSLGLTGIDTGLQDLNTMTDGIQKGDLVILAARPSVGKTALALNFAMNACLNKNRVLFYSFEMPKKQLLQRMLSSLTRIDLMYLRKSTKPLTIEETKLIANKYSTISEWDLIISDEKGGQTVQDICISMRSHLKNNQDKDSLVIIDYLQLVRTNKSINRHDLQIGEITRELKLLAKELNIPIVLISQLNRNVESRNDKRPMMSDLRDSGNIEQDADVIFLLHREDYYNRESALKNVIELNIAKHRNGPVGTVELLYSKEIGIFSDYNY